LKKHKSKLSKHTRRTPLTLGCGVFGEKTHSTHPWEAETVCYTSRKTRDVGPKETKQKGLYSRLVIMVLAFFIPLADFLVYVCIVV